jgi:FkbM family methyltransferase
MSQPLIDSLETGARLHSASKLYKVLTIPRRLAYARWTRLVGRPAKTAARTFWGEQMTLVLPEPVSTTIYQYGFLEYDLSRAFIECIKPGMTFFDVGAHFGYFTCLASHLVGPSGQVHSFEPTPSTYAILSENAAARRNVRTNNVAAYSQSTTLTFNDFGLAYSAFNSMSSARLDEDQRAQLKPTSYQATTITLDEYVQQSGAKPDVIKIDAESSELDILLGMDNILSEIKPIISLEVGDYGLEGVASSASVVQHLIGKNYRPHEWRDGALRLHIQRADYRFGNLLFIPVK